LKNGHQFLKTRDKNSTPNKNKAEMKFGESKANGGLEKIRASKLLCRN
jgi:hypothetical protein